MEWAKPSLSIGFVIALVVLIVDCILKAMGLIELDAALVVAAITALRL